MRHKRTGEYPRSLRGIRPSHGRGLLHIFPEIQPTGCRSQHPVRDMAGHNAGLCPAGRHDRRGLRVPNRYECAHVNNSSSTSATSTFHTPDPKTLPRIIPPSRFKPVPTIRDRVKAFAVSNDEPELLTHDYQRFLTAALEGLEGVRMSASREVRNEPSEPLIISPHTQLHTILRTTSQLLNATTDAISTSTPSPLNSLDRATNDRLLHETKHLIGSTTRLIHTTSKAMKTIRALAPLASRGSAPLESSQGSGLRGGESCGRPGAINGRSVSSQNAKDTTDPPTRFKPPSTNGSQEHPRSRQRLASVPAAADICTRPNRNLPPKKPPLFSQRHISARPDSTPGTIGKRRRRRLGAYRLTPHGRLPRHVDFPYTRNKQSLRI